MGRPGELGKLTSHEWEQLQSLADRFETACQDTIVADLRDFLPPAAPCKALRQRQRSPPLRPNRNQAPRWQRCDRCQKATNRSSALGAAALQKSGSTTRLVKFRWPSRSSSSRWKRMRPSENMKR